MRSLLRIDEKKLLSDRTFRNHFEHYDERIEKWTENRNSYIDWAMNPSMYAYGHGYVSRGYNVYNNTLVFQGEILDLNAVLEALREIKEKCIK